MNAFIVAVMADLNARIDANDAVAYNHYDADRNRIVVTRINTGDLYTYVVDCRSNIVFLPYHG